MELGLFSVSLTVKDLETSQRFYEKLGFEVAGGDRGQNYLIMRNGATVIGLFHGMFEDNILTFNPGLGPDGERLGSFTDIRELQRELKERGVDIHTACDEDSTGPASLVLLDPDGNPILIDQFF